MDTKPPVGSKQPDTAAEMPSIKTPEFGIGIALFGLLVTIVLTALAARMKDLSWLFALAWLFAIPTIWLFCGRLKPKRLRIALITIVLAATAGGLYFLNLHTQPENPAPVEISPSEVVFRQVTINENSSPIPNQFSQQYLFRITNTTDRDIYSIGAELKIKSTHLSIVDFNLEIPKSSWKSLNDNDPTGMQIGDMMAVGCTNKQTNQGFFVVEITHLRPHESREISIWESDRKAGNEDEATVTGNMYHFTFEPAPTLRSDKGSMFLPDIPFPETGTIEKIVMLHLPK